MKKILFFSILLSIIFYGFLSNYSKKKEIRSYFQKNTVSQSPDNKDDIYGCESKGIIPSRYCRFTKNECSENFLLPLYSILEIVKNDENNILHCTNYKLGVDGLGFDILVNNLTNNNLLKIKDKFTKSKLSEINSFQPGEGLCVKPNNSSIKYGIISDSLRQKLCSAIKNDIEVTYFQKLYNGNYINMIYLGLDNIFWFNETGY